MGCDKRDRDTERDSMSEGRFQISFTQDGETRVITLEGNRADYEIEYEDGELELAAREGDFEWEFGDVDSFEFLPLSSEV